MENIVIIGAGGFAREVLDVIDAINCDKNIYNVLGFIVDSQFGKPGTVINNLPILGNLEWLEKKSNTISVICGVGLPNQRYKLIKRAESLGCSFVSIVHPSAITTRWVKIGKGVVITAGCILTNQIDIRNHVHLNLNTTIGHDCVISDYVTLSPGTHISGNVIIEEGAFIGTGSNIIEKVTIGRWSTIGAGSTVIKDVMANSTVVGVPAKLITTKEDDWCSKH